MHNEKGKRIALIYGGAGAERSVSLRGAEYVSRLIKEAGYRPLHIVIEKSGNWKILEKGKKRNTYPVKIGSRCGFLDGDKILSVACAFPLLHGDFGEDGRVQGALDCAGIKYAGCGVTAGAVAFDKIYTKIIAESIGIPTVKWLGFSGDGCSVARLDCERELGYPMFVKPAAMGSSIGASPVENPSEFARAYSEAAKHGKRILVEKMLRSPRELECAVLLTEGKEIFSHPGEIHLGSFYSYSEKYSKGSRAKPKTNASLDEGVCGEIKRYSRMICRALGVRQIARVDFFLDGNRLYLNEINTLPGFTESSLYPKLIESEGLTPAEAVGLLIKDTLL